MDRPVSLPRGVAAVAAAALTCLLLGAVSLGAAGLAHTAPAGWVAQPTRSAMRVAQWTLPRAPGDAEDAELVVYFFGAGQGGSVRANLDRWLGQVQQPDGRPSTAVATTETSMVNGLRVTLLDVSGRYVAETAPGSGERVDRPGYRLRAAVIETPGGPYFAKLTGPAKTVARWDADFRTWLGSVSYR
jgi:hypothetical protein